MVIISIIYIGSCLININWFRTAHGNDGKYESLDLDMIDVLWVYTPLFNTVVAISNSLTSPYKIDNKYKSRLPEMLIGETK